MMLLQRQFCFFDVFWSYTKAFTDDAPFIDPFPHSDSISFQSWIGGFLGCGRQPTSCQASKVYILHVIAVVLGNWMKLGHLSIASSKLQGEANTRQLNIAQPTDLPIKVTIPGRVSSLPRSAKYRNRDFCAFG